MDVISAPAAWFGALFHPQSLVELRAIRADAEPKVAIEWIRAKDIGSDGVQGLLQRWTEQGRNIYAGVNPRSKRDGTAKGVDHARALFVDLDGWTEEEARALPAKAKLPPFSLLVSSGHGYHGYWILPEPILDLQLWTRYQLALISLCGSDPCIHDPPRIMRIPGTVNFKSNPPTPCVLLETGPIAPPVAEWITPADEKSLPSPAILPRTGGITDWRQNISRASMAYLLTGASLPEGGRNSALFKAASDAAGNGCGFADAMDILGGVAASSGLSADEIETTIRSAFSKDRSPSRPSRPAGEATAYSAWNPTEPEEPKRRPILSNIGTRQVTDSEGKKKTEPSYKSIEQFAAEIQEAAGNWPRKAAGSLFALKRDIIAADGLPKPRALYDLETADALGAWLHTIADVRWMGSKGAPKNAEGSPLTAPTKREVWEHLDQTVEPDYRSVGVLPHTPPMEGIFYLPCNLPTPTGEALRELLAHLNPETEDDRQLLKAAILTPGWGGEPGRRPPFCLTSTHGKGVGKTTTVQVIAEMLWGGAFTIKKDETFEKIVSRMVCLDGVGIRCVIIDNVKGRYGGEQIESLVTLKTIDGWKPYHGQASRPNDLTYFITANTPRLSDDLAKRVVTIEIGKQKHGVSFVEWASGFIRANRAQLVSDVMAELAAEPKGKISAANRDRWQDWQDSVLTRCENPDRLAALACSRRDDINDDAEDADRAAEAIKKYIREKSLGSGTVVFTRDEMREVLVKARVVGDEMGTKGVTRWLEGLKSDDGPLAALKNSKSHGARTWLWGRTDSVNDISEDDIGIPV